MLPFYSSLNKIGKGEISFGPMEQKYFWTYFSIGGKNRRCTICDENLIYMV